MKIIFRSILAVAALMCLSLLAACSQPQRAQQAPLPELSVGVVPFFQPTSTIELMAGYIPDDQGHIDPESLLRIDTNLRTALDKTGRSYKYLDAVGYKEGKEVGMAMRQNRRSALSFWAEIGKREGVDLLIVPTVVDWHERQGGEAGVTTSAAVTIDIFLIDCRGEGNLLQRAYYSEKQTGLANNLLNIGTFFKRGAKWVTAEQLTQEAIEKAIQEFGL